MTANNGYAKPMHGVQKSKLLQWYLESLLTRTIQSKRHCSFPCHVNCKKQSLTIVSLYTSLRATSIVAILQVPDGKDSGLSISSVRVYIILMSLMTVSYGWVNTKHIRDFATRTGKFMQVYTKREVDKALVKPITWPV